LGLFLPTMAQTKEDADAALSRQDYTTAARLYRSLAEQGKASAQHQRAKIYENGEGAPKGKPRQRSGIASLRNRAMPVHNSTPAEFCRRRRAPRLCAGVCVWFSLSAAAGQGEFALQGRDQAADKMSAAQVAEAERRVRAWKPAKAQ
jgi:TPR repeat protein